MIFVFKVKIFYEFFYLLTFAYENSVTDYLGKQVDKDTEGAYVFTM